MPHASMSDVHWYKVTPDADPYGPLTGDCDADVLIIGGGFTGLSTALHLAEQGVAVALIEAVEPGHGASGRNNGQVIPTLSRADPDMLTKNHGAAGDRFADLIGGSAAFLFDLVRKHGLKAEAEQTGWVQPVHSPGRMKLAESRMRQWEKRGAPVALLSKDAVTEMTGSELWYGGWWNRTGGHINPLALVREMARKATELGARIFTGQAAQSLTRENGFWVVRTEGQGRGIGGPGSQLRARALLLATHSYTGEFARGLKPGLAREVVPVLSWQMATEPLGHNMRAKILPGRPAMSDTHGDLHFARYDARHQLVTGGALALDVNGPERIKAVVGARLKRMFPEIGDVRFTSVWNGYIGMTDDYTPRFHQIGPDAYAWAGCNGRGVALSVSLGPVFAAALTGANPADLPLPFTKITPLPLHGLIRRVSPLMLLEYRRRDAREIT